MIIGNKAEGGGSIVSATPTSITVDGVTTNINTDLTEAGTKLWNTVRGAWELKRAAHGRFPSVANNGSDKIRITCVGHTLITGDTIDIHDSSVSGYNGTGLTVTRISADAFDIEATAYSATGTGYFRCVANTYRAANQDGPVVQGALVLSRYVVNMPDVNGSPVLVNCSDFIRSETGGRIIGAYKRVGSDPSINTVHDFVQTVVSGDLKWYSTSGASTAGKLMRIDYVA